MSAGARVLGHPVHAMLIHFPVALWPAHFALHLAAAHLPEATAVLIGFWLLVAGAALGWLAAVCGAIDLLALAQENNPARLRTGLIHASINGGALLGFTTLAVLEAARYPAVHHGPVFLTTEAALLTLMLLGNYFGGALIWGKRAPLKP